MRPHTDAGLDHRSGRVKGGRPGAAWYRGQAGDLGMSITVYTRPAVLTNAAYGANPSAVGQGVAARPASIVNPETMFQAGSTSKPIAAMAALTA
jgi:CubicO group peptidase (beta-lactamase class C family)